MRHPLHDYAKSAAYSVTFCTYERDPRLARVRGDESELTPAGKIVKAVWHSLPKHYPRLQLDALAIMHDHVHAILILVEPCFVTPDQAAGRISEKPYGLSEVVRGWKSISARKINVLEDAAGSKVWDDGFYDRVLRNDKEVERHRAYIMNNPLKWWLKNGSD